MDTDRSRRGFLALVPAVLATPAFIGCSGRPRDAGAPAVVKTTPPAPRIAVIGCGGRGWDNLNDLLGAGADVVALCDVDATALEKAVQRVPTAAAYRDYRLMFRDRRKLGIDGVLVATPDHTHAFATALALRAGLAAYCEKPLTHTLEESHRILDLARASRTPTQMGTQIHATENYRRVVELIRAGAIGAVTSCDCWVNKGWCCGPTGPVADPPQQLDYDLWLGPAQEAPYVANLHPANWRKYWAYGTGTLGDMGCHMLDLPVWALGLDRKRLGAVECFATVDKVDSIGCPEWTEASWAIPRTREGAGSDGGLTDPLVLRWFDNGRISPTAQELGAKDKVDYHGRFNMVFQGTKGWLWANYGEFLITPGALAAEPLPRVDAIPASPGHHREWLDSIASWRAGDSTAAGRPLCAFQRSSVLNELVLSGTVAARAQRPLRYHFERRMFEAGPPIGHWHPAPRQGWSLSNSDLDAVLDGTIV